MDRRDLIRGHRLADRRNDRNSARDRRFEGDRASEFSRSSKNFVAVFAEQRLVRGDDVFARFQQPQHDRASRLNAADHVQRDIDLLIGIHRFGIVGDHVGGQFDAALLFWILDHDSSNLDRAAGSASDPLCLISQDPRDTSSDGAHSDQRDSQGRGGWHVNPFNF